MLGHHCPSLVPSPTRRASASGSRRSTCHSLCIHLLLTMYPSVTHYVSTCHSLYIRLSLRSDQSAQTARPNRNRTASLTEAQLFRNANVDAARKREAVECNDGVPGRPFRRRSSSESEVQPKHRYFCFLRIWICNLDVLALSPFWIAATCHSLCVPPLFTMYPPPQVEDSTRDPLIEIVDAVHDVWGAEINTMGNHISAVPTCRITPSARFIRACWHTQKWEPFTWT